jgi:phenylacetate-coenzyme A ligase PaaK-like adenylate-forming protein
MRTQPIIRYEITDLVRLSPEPCPCGSPFRTVAAIEGRSDDVLRLPGDAGAAVAVHPMHLRSPLARLESVRQYQIVHRTDGVHVLLVPRGDGGVAAGEVRAAVAGALAAVGAGRTPVHVEAVDVIAREGGAGKFKLVRSEVGGAAAQATASMFSRT